MSIKFDTENYCYEKVDNSSLTFDQQQLLQDFIKTVENSEAFKEYQLLSAQADDLIKNHCLKTVFGVALIPIPLFTLFWGCYPCRIDSTREKYYSAQTTYIQYMMNTTNQYNDKLKSTGYEITLQPFDPNPEGQKIKLKKSKFFCKQYHIGIGKRIADVEDMVQELYDLQVVTQQIIIQQ